MAIKNIIGVRRSFSACLCVLASAISFPVSADETICSGEIITTVTTVGDEVYFTTDKSCPNWCKLSSSLSASAKDRFYAQLLTASVTKTHVDIFWQLVSTPCAVEPAGAEPTHLVLRP